MKTTLLAAMCLGLCTQLSASTGEVYIPESQDEVLFTISDAYLGGSEFQQEGGETASSAEQIIVTARQFLDRAYQTGDDRFVSYAERELNQWIGKNQSGYVPFDIYVMQARTAQRNHEFQSADRILRAVLEKNPKHGEANLVLAYGLMAQGKSDEAEIHCRKVMANMDQVLGLICQSRSLLLQGRQPEALKRLSFLVQRNDLPENYLIELKLTLAEMAKWQGNAHLAEKLLQEVTALDKSNIVAKIQLADIYLLDQRYIGVDTLLADESHPALRLRRDIANAAMTDRAISGTRQISADEIMRALGRTDDATRDDVLLLLHAGYGDAALRAAQSMWKSQREPDDALVYLQAAEYSASRDDVRKVHRWVLATGLQDRRLLPYLTNFKPLAKLDVTQGGAQ